MCIIHETARNLKTCNLFFFASLLQIHGAAECVDSNIRQDILNIIKKNIWMIKNLHRHENV